MKKIKLKKKSLEDSLSGHTTQVEERKVIEVVGNNKVTEYLRVAEEYFDYFKRGFKVSLIAFQLRETVGALTSEEAALFLDASKVFMDERNYAEIFSGFFKEVIHGSRDAGYREFEFDLQGFGQHNPFGNIWGNVNNDESERTKITFRNVSNSINLLRGCHYLDVVVKGDVGYGFGFGAKNSLHHIEGNAEGAMGNSSSQSKFIVDGNIDYSFGYNSSQSYFDLRGNVSSHYLAKQAKDSTFRIGGDLVGDYWVGDFNAQNCKFISPDENVIEYLLNHLFFGHGHKIYRELEDGKLQEVSK